MWLGICSCDVLPSPKVHAHEVGLPVERSLNVNALPASAVVGVVSKAACTVGTPGIGAVTVTPAEYCDCVTPSLAVRTTKYCPAEAKMCVGLVEVETNPSPKFQVRDVMPPLD